MVVQSYCLNNDFETLQKEFFISNTICEQSLIGAIVIFPEFSFSAIIPKTIFSFLGTEGESPQSDPKFKMILWLIIAGTRGGPNRAKILNLIKETPMNANKISKVLNVDHKTVKHHVEILTKNDLIVKAQKDYGAEYHLSPIMKENQNVLEEIMRKIGKMIHFMLLHLVHHLNVHHDLVILNMKDLIMVI